MLNHAKTSVGTWKDFRDDLFAVNPDLTAIIDEMDPDKSFRLYKIRYPYGSEIVKSGEFYLPNSDGKIVSINDKTITNDVRKDLSYNSGSIPVGMMIKNSIEVYINHQGISVPLVGHRHYIGKLFGLSHNLNNQNSFNIPIALWNITAGGRSVFMLPKISNLTGHNRIKKEFNIQVDAPRSLSDQWSVFRSLYQSDAFKSDWEVEVIFFSSSWFDNFNETSWMLFFNYFYRNLVSLTDYFRKSQTWEAMLSLLRLDKNVGHNAYINHKVRHILGIATGELPAFAPAVDDSFGPFSDIQKIYTDIYDLKGHAPVMLQPRFLDDSKSNAPATNPVYYSLNHPTVMFPAGKHNEHSVMTNLNDTASLLGRYMRAIKEQQDEIRIEQFDHLIDHIDFNFYHSSNSSYGFVKSSKELPTTDKNWHKDGKSMAAHGPFLQGCVQVYPKVAQTCV